MARAGDELAQELVVAGAVEDEGLHAVGEKAREQDVDQERLAAAGARVDQQRAVVVRGVERVDQRDLAARVGERERDPGGRPARGADERDGVADVAGDVLARQASDVAPQGERGLPELELAQLAEVHARVGGGDDLAGGLLDGLGELDRVGVGAALADRLVDRDLKRRRPLVPGQLLEQLAELLLLGEHLVVGRATTDLGAAVDAEQPAVARLEARALVQPVQRVHVHRERERPLDLHRVQQPAELGRVRQRRDVQRLLEVAIDAQVALIGPIDPRPGDQLAQRVRRPGGGAGVGDGVEFADDLEAILAGARPPVGSAIGGRGVEAPPQQVEDLRAREQVRGEVERLQVGPDRVGEVQRLARHPPMGRERALQRRAREPPSRAREQRAPVEPGALVGQVGDDDVVGDVDGGLLIGVALQRLAQGRVQAAQRIGSAVVVGGERADRALGVVLAVREQRVEPDGRGLDVELDRLAGR